MLRYYQQSKSQWDKWGIALSGLCLVHCLLTPVLILLLPWLGGHLKESYFHAMLFIIIFPLAFITFYSGHKIHQSKRPLVLGILGLACLAGDLILPKSIHELHFIHTSLTVLGSVLMVLAHYYNWRCQCHHHHHHHHH